MPYKASSSWLGGYLVISLDGMIRRYTIFSDMHHNVGRIYYDSRYFDGYNVKNAI